MKLFLTIVWKFQYAQKHVYGCRAAKEVAALITITSEPELILQILPCAAGAGKLPGIFLLHQLTLQ